MMELNFSYAFCEENAEVVPSFNMRYMLVGLVLTTFESLASRQDMGLSNITLK